MNKNIATWLCNRILSQIAHRSSRRRRRQADACRNTANWGLAAEVQLLEVRALLSGSPTAQAAAIDLVRYYNDGAVTPNSSSTAPGYTPAQIKQAYGFNQISFNGTAGDGTGTTIAIVDAYDDPNIASDLHQFSLAFGLPDPPSFTKVNQYGSTSSLPTTDSGWITEIALDVEWAHAIAPGAKILLVEANSSSFSDLSTAVNTARNTDGVNVVSMSWGGSEFSGEQFYDQYFTTPWGHAGVTFVASSGDTGAPTQSPSSSPNVVSVGGTTLTLGAGGTWSSETGWSGSGGGISAYESQPSYQQGVVTQTTTFRADPDVSYNSNPSTGFGVYDSYNNGSTNPWGQWGGTSAAAPQWAALIAIADQGRALAGEGSLDGRSQTLPMLYSMSANNFHDITSGTSTGSTHYSAGPGYDLVTGRGTPFANLVVNDLVGVPLAVAPTLTTISTLGIAAPLVPFSISYATLLGASNGQDSNNAALQFYINGVQNGTLTITHNGVTTAVVAGTTLLGTGDSLTWTGAAGITGSPLNAFTVTAFDGSLSSSTPVQVKINVQALPTLSAISTFGIASPQAPFSISYATLLGASNAQDSNNAAIQFRINSLQNGTLTITHNGVTTAVVAGTTLLGTGDSLTWMGPAGLTGTAVNAFTVTAFDGTLSSSTAVQVTIDVQAAPTQQRYIETFDSTTALQSYTVLGGRTPNFQISSVAAQNGPYGLSASSSNDWIYRNPSPALVQAGDTISVWLQFTRSTNGGAYFGFGASSAGTLALVAAPNTNQLLLQQVNFLSNTSQGGSFANLAAAPQSYTKNTWYRLEVEWSTSGSIIGNLYASDGTTLLNSVKYSGSTGITSGGIAFRATGNSPKYFDSVSDTTGVNSFATQSAVVGRSASVAVDRTDAPPVANAAILIDGNVVATSSVDLTVDPSLNDWQLRRNSLGSKRSG